ncbi:MAG: YjbQ family protein, partial [Acidobacteriota bacterium]|nr:YjbQ family protein [Acidobacteriota bacterium]
MKQFTRQLHVQTRGKGLYDFTRQVAGWVDELRLNTGLLTVFIQHTSASLTIQENA